MGLFIEKGASLLPDNATIDLIAITNMDTGYGENILSASRNQVTYIRSLGGVCQLRIDDLVNENTYSSPPDIIIFAVDGSFLLADGTPITNIAGIALPVGNALNPTASDVATIYDTSDCNGNHWWVDQDGGGTTSFPSSVILYHELAHCFHFVTGVASTEPLAETDENDMRDQLGITHRDINSHNGGCGGTGYTCCIVASISTGSHYSKEVNHLRFLRDKILRRSEVGDDFFKQLHYEYYAFSPEICNLMGNNSVLRDLIKSFFVTPLIYSLELITYYIDHKGAGLENYLALQKKNILTNNEFDLSLLEPMKDCLRIIREENNIPGKFTNLPNWPIEVKGIEDLLQHINNKALNSEIINWALLQSLTIWVEMMLVLQAEYIVKYFEKQISSSISNWICRLPVTEIWGNLSRIETELELKNLNNYIFDRKGKTYFAERLLKLYPNHSETIIQWSLN